MNRRRRAVAASAGIVLVFLLVQFGALALVEPFEQQGQQFVEDTSDPTNSLVYVGAILVATVAMLAAFRFDVDWLVRAFVIFSGVYIALYVFRAIVPALVVVPVAGFDLNALAWLGAVGLGVALYAYPEWYVVDSAGIVMGIGAAGLFGINFGILPSLVLLTVLAVYDAISVYGTEHMLDLASGVMDLRVPVVLVVPLTLSYSFLDAETPDPTGEREESEAAVEETTSDSETGSDTEAMGDTKPEETGALANGGADDGGRDALFIGLGDAVIPTVLVASAGFFLSDAPATNLAGVTVSLPAGGAMIGTLAGLVVLLWMVLKGRAHAGLPLLNGGAIAGYLVGALASGITLVEALGLSGF